MAYLLDFEDEKCEKGYKQFYPSRENLRANVGKAICFVNHVDARGNYRVRYGRIHSVRYSRLFLNEGHDEVDIRGIKDCGIKIEPDNE